MEDNSKECEYYSVNEIAAMLGVNRLTVCNNILPHVKHVHIGRAIRVRRDEFHRYMKQLERG